MKHDPNAGCTAQDQILVTGGIACGKCGASSLPRLPDDYWCADVDIGGQPCPLPRGEVGEYCWIHRTIRQLLDCTGMPGPGSMR